MQELENLLNSLIQRGWKPWGKYDKILNVSKNHGWLMRMVESNNVWMYVHIRSIVSIESELWQFCVENKMVNWWIWIGRNKRIKTKEGGKSMQRHWKNNHQYRLLESALIPEEELAKFLVGNIRINESLWTAD